MKKILTGTIIKNTTWLFASQIATKLLSLVFMIYLGRTLIVSDFGKFNLANALVAIYGIFVDFGFNMYMVREMAKDRSRIGEILISILPFKLLITLFVLLSIWLTTRFMGYDPATNYVIAGIGIYYVLMSYSAFFRTVFMATEMMQYEAIFSIIDKALVFVGGVLLITGNRGIVSLSVLYPAVEAFILCAGLYVLLKRFPDIKYVFSRNTMISSIKESLPFFFSGIFMMVYLYIDSVMLSKMQNETAVGVYNASYGLVYNLRILVSPFITSIFPSMAFHADTDRAHLLHMFRNVRKVILISGIAIAIIAFALSKQIIMLLYGVKMLASVPVFSILIWANPFIYMNGFYSYTLVSLGEQKSLFKFLVIATIANVIMNLIAIPRYSYYGASTTTVLSEMIFFILCSFRLNSLGFK
jgi:O-antigen/teichoic acid export membrane protein